MSTELLLLLVIFQIKHLVADYYLQFPYMYENKGKKAFSDWFEPLTFHAGTHALITFTIVLVYYFTVQKVSPFVLSLAPMFDYVTHFVIDRWKATRGHHPGESMFWIELGIDQMLHHIVGILIVLAIIQQ